MEGGGTGPYVFSLQDVLERSESWCLAESPGKGEGEQRSSSSADNPFKRGRRILGLEKHTLGRRNKATLK